ncbi:MAG: hypothetical protein JJU12_05680 [Chlamydiales bacterium]|nr:hypothetical protein [Chlamydiales bacterium]
MYRYESTTESSQKVEKANQPPNSDEVKEIPPVQQDPNESINSTGEENNQLTLQDPNPFPFTGERGLDSSEKESSHVGEDLGQAEDIVIPENASEVSASQPIDTFRQMLPQIFTAAGELFIAFVTAYARSEKKSQKNNKELITIKNAFKSLQVLTDQILQDKLQLLRFTLGALLPFYVDSKSIILYLNKNSNISDFISKLPEFLIKNTEKKEAEIELKSTYNLLNKISSGLEPPKQRNNETFKKLYDKLREASKKLEKARLEYENLRQPNNKEKIDKALTTLQMSEVEFNYALVSLVDRLLLEGKTDKDSLYDLVAPLIAQKSVILGPLIFEALFVNFAPLRSGTGILYYVKSLYLSNFFNDVTIRGGLYTATSFKGKLIHKKAKNVIENFPLAEQYQKSLFEFVEKIIPPLMNPIYFATAGVKGTLKQAPHPFRVAFQEQIIGEESFALPKADENPETHDWPGYAAALVKILNRFTTQLNELKFT